MTRRYLVRVCKEWHRLAFLYLYEWVLASRLKNLWGIVRALERQFFGDPQTCVGWCARRLDIDFRSTGDETLEEMDHEGHLILRLLRAVPNLLVLSVGTCYNRIWTRSSWSHTYCPRLEFFNWTSGGEVFEPEAWVHFVQSHPKLIAINAPTLGYSSTTQLPPPHMLKELTLGLICPVPTSAVFTSLRRLNIDVFATDVHLVNPHLRHGLITESLPSITALQLSFANYRVNLDSELKAAEFLFQFLPNLLRIDLVLPEWPQIWFGYVFPSNISVLGLRVCSVKPKR